MPINVCAVLLNGKWHLSEWTELTDPCLLAHWKLQFWGDGKNTSHSRSSTQLERVALRDHTALCDKANALWLHACCCMWPNRPTLIWPAMILVSSHLTCPSIILLFSDRHVDIPCIIDDMYIYSVRYFQLVFLLFVTEMYMQPVIRCTFHDSKPVQYLTGSAEVNQYYLLISKYNTTINYIFILNNKTQCKPKCWPGFLLLL